MFEIGATEYGPVVKLFHSTLSINANTVVDEVKIEFIHEQTSRKISVEAIGFGSLNPLEDTFEIFHPVICKMGEVNSTCTFFTDSKTKKSLEASVKAYAQAAMEWKQSIPTSNKSDVESSFKKFTELENWKLHKELESAFPWADGEYRAKLVCYANARPIGTSVFRFTLPRDTVDSMRLKLHSVARKLFGLEYFYNNEMVEVTSQEPQHRAKV